MAQHELKMAAVYNFIQLIEWPEDAFAAGETFRICASDNLPWYATLSRLGIRMAYGHRISVLPIVTGQLSSCHVIVLEGSDKALVYPVRREIASRSVLVIGDGMEVRDGVMIAMHIEARRIVFDVDATLARQAGLGLSSRLLKLARVVQ